MTISWLQAALLGLFACLSSMPGVGGTSIGNYTLGRPLVGGLVSGLILGDIKLGIVCGVAMQLVYIALVTPCLLYTSKLVLSTNTIVQKVEQTLVQLISKTVVFHLQLSEFALVISTPIKHSMQWMTSYKLRHSCKQL